MWPFDLLLLEINHTHENKALYAELYQYICVGPFCYIYTPLSDPNHIDVQIDATSHIAYTGLFLIVVQDMWLPRYRDDINTMKD